MKKYFIYILFCIILLNSVSAQEFIETTNPSYTTQQYNRGTGYFYKPSVDVNITSVTRSAVEVGANLVIYNNGSNKYFEGNTWVSNVQQVGIILNASTTYAIMIYPNGCINRNNAHDTGLSGTYPIETNKGNVTGAVISNSGCGQPETYIDTDGYSLMSWNVSIPSVGGGGSDISLTINHDMDNGTINFNQNPFVTYFNFTLGSDNTNTSLDCDFLVDGSVDQDFNNSDSSLIYNFTYGTSGIESNVTFEISCYNNETSDSTGVYFYNIDTVTPVINLCEPVFINNSNINLLGEFSICLNISDKNLFAYNSTLRNKNGNILFNNFVENLTVNQTSFSESYIMDTLGVYYYDIFVFDSHTRKLIPRNFKIDYINSGFTVEDDITITSPDIKSSLVWFDDVKQDRYKFKITFQDNKINHSFTLQTTENLVYLPDSNYLGHFVYFPKKLWIDLESDNIKKVNVFKINGNTYNINVELFNASDEIEVDSIGQLNVESKTFGFVVQSQPFNTTGIENSIEGITEGVKMFVYMLLFIVGVILLYLNDTKFYDVKISIFTFVIFLYLRNVFKVADTNGFNLIVFGVVLYNLLQMMKLVFRKKG